MKGKTFLEVGCGPCPIGQRLAKQGAKRIYGLDISSQMIEAAQRNLEVLGMADKFELICHDIFDESFNLDEKVDCVVLSYTLTTFITNYEMLEKIIKRCSQQVKEDGFLFIADFSWVDQPCDDFFFGMYTSFEGGKRAPKEFEIFNFYIDNAPEYPFEIFHIPNYLMFKAGYEAGFAHIEHLPQYPDPEFKEDKRIRRYLEECNPSDYLIKFKFMTL